MRDDKREMTGRSEDIRLRYFYRNMVCRGKARLSLESARKLVGPDCAYHLYATAGLFRMKKRR